MLAHQDIQVQGSNVVSTQGTVLAAQNHITLEAAKNTKVESHLKDEKLSGLFGTGGMGFTVGTRQQSVDQDGTTNTAAASTVGSLEGNVSLQAGKNYSQVGSNVVAPQGSIDIAAQKVNIEEARDTSQNETETKFKQSGLTLALSSPVISALQTAQQMSKAAGQTSDSRMQLLAGASTAMAGLNAYGAVKAGQGSTIDGKPNQIATTDAAGKPTSRDANAADQAGGINVSISIGGSNSQSHTTQTSDNAAGSSVAAGGDISIRASGAAQNSDLTVQGSSVKAGHNVTLQADNQINLLAAQNTAEQHSTNKNSSASVGIGFALGGTQNGFSINVGVSGGRGNADGRDVGHTNTHVEAGNQLSINSGGDTTLKGAVAKATQVNADIGGNLNIESLQDTSQYDSKQKSVSAGVSLCIPPICYGASSANASASKSKVNSNYASVTEQSGIQAGDGGFNIHVKGNTDLKGGAITSTDQAIREGKNTLTTATLTTSDLQNQASASAKSSGFSLDSNMLNQGKYGVGKAVVGNVLTAGNESGSSAGSTRSVVSAAVVTITDDAAQKALTGSSAEQIVASLNRDVAGAHTAAQRQDVDAMQRSANAAFAIKQQAFKEITVHTDAAYKGMFKTDTKFYKVTCQTTPAECLKDPKLVKTDEITRDEAKRDGKIIAVNGILNDAPRAGELAYQNVPDELETGQKPSSITLMHIPQADTVLGEIFVAGYEKLFASTLGYTIAEETYADLLQGRGSQETVSLGHSRGTIVQLNAFNILAEQGYTNEKLSVAGVDGAVGYGDYANTAVKIIKEENEGNVTFTYLANDPVAVIAAGNPGDAMAAFREFFNVIAKDNSAHSCYGTGAAGCATIANPVPGGPTPTNQDPNLIRTYRGGELVIPKP